MSFCIRRFHNRISNEKAEKNNKDSFIIAAGGANRMQGFLLRFLGLFFRVFAEFVYLSFTHFFNIRRHNIIKLYIETYIPINITI